MYLFTSESVSEGHPDKVADQISDAILDNFLALDCKSKVACETLVTTGLAVIAGEVRSNAYVDLQNVARDTIRRIGYTKAEYQFDANSCGVISTIHEQSADINRGVDKENPDEQGAGDQGMMFGYASNETENFMPLPLYLAHLFVETLADIRKRGQIMTYLRPDAKSQVTIEYDEERKAVAIDTVVISTQHDEFGSDRTMQERIAEDVRRVLFPEVIGRVKNQKVRDLLVKGARHLYVNPTGKFVIGGPHGDTGLTGRKIIVDTYGGRGAHGGGAFSGKDPSKVDRSAAYMARYIAKNMVAAGVADEMLVQLSYAIGVAEPVSVNVNTFGTSHTEYCDDAIAEYVKKSFGLKPHEIESSLKLRNPIYEETAAYGHMGRECKVVTKTFKSAYEEVRVEVELFTWEKLDRVEEIRCALL